MDEGAIYAPSSQAALRSTRRSRKASVGSLTSTQSLSRIDEGSSNIQTGPPTASPQRRLPHLRTRTSFRATSGSETDTTEILSPIPRRHLLQTSESQQWLRNHSVSPVTVSSSRPISPAMSPRPPSLLGRQPVGMQHVSFSALLQKDKEKDHEQEVSAARRWVRFMRKYGLGSWILPSAIVAATWIKWSIGLGSYSGYNTPPMYGDYEAQRHWMELTIHLHLRQWYTYDLQYWGLDYPPLTAYVSWICGIVGSWINPSWFALDQSRGIESEGSKIFMRLSVLAFDALIYIPALVMFVKTWQATRSRRTQDAALLLLLLQPGLLLIDFGHFQYNSVMLGLTLMAMNCFVIGKDLWGAFFFVMSLGFKQMALYYAPAIGSYLLAKCLYLGPTEGVRLFINLAIVTLLSFLVLFLPFLPPFASFTAILDPITRIFPFARGLFEDKVANFWCASNVVLKWKYLMPDSALVKLSTALTAVAFLPGAVALLHTGWSLRPSGTSETMSDKEKAPTPLLTLLPYALLTSAFGFFLFSFQVHEKTILLPLLPMTLLLSSAQVDSSAFGWGMLTNNTAVFSMWPLLRRDGLALQYIATLLLWNRLVGYNPFRLPHRSFIQILSIGVYAAALILHIAEPLITPPARYPDLFPVLNVLVSAPVFGLAWLWSIKRCVEIKWSLGGLGTSTTSKPVTGTQESMSTPSSPTLKSVLEKNMNGTNGSMPGLVRKGGSRTMSLGYAQGRGFRPQLGTIPMSSRPASVGPDSMRPPPSA